MTEFVVQVNTGKGWRKRRDIDPVPFGHVVMWTRDDDGNEVEHRRTREDARARAARLAESCERAPRRESCSDGYPHRVVER
jgi:hypothetical protein